MGLANKLDPFVPTMGDPWDRSKAGHLMRRAGFGGVPAELDALLGDGSQAALGAAVDNLVDYPDTSAATDSRLTTFGGGVAAPTTASELEGHWYFRMRFTDAPLQEQFTLFLHDHFATQFDKIRSKVSIPPAFMGENTTAAEIAKATQIMKTQNDLFRTQGIKDFRSLLIAETRDPAMLLFLDNWKNIWVAGNPKPQENFSRELMELFSMGVNQYSEDDVRELARVVTGENLDDAINLGYLYRPDVHDPDPKTFLGQVVDLPSGPAETEEAIDIILASVASPQFMATKLLQWFVHPTPDALAVTELAAELSSNGFVFREALRKLFKSIYFFEAQNTFALYKTPADYGVEMIRQLEFRETEMPTDFNWTGLASLIGGFGMTLFAPPNVGGWIQGEAWINSVNIINRFNLAQIVVQEQFLSDAKVNTYFGAPLAATNQQIIDEMRDRLLQDDLRTGEQNILFAHLAFIDVLGGAAQDVYRKKVASAAHLLLASPKAQLK